MIKAAALLAGLLLFPGSTATRLEAEATPDMNNLCRGFVAWQRIMKAAGHPPNTYAGTGMERHCPGMI